MQWTFFIKEKIKVAFALALVMVVILLINVFTKRQISHLDASVKTLYNDRLVAGQDISSSIEIFYENRLLLEEHIHTQKTDVLRVLEKQIVHNNLLIDSLIREFKKTLLVRPEHQALATYQLQMTQYRALQQHLLSLSQRGEKEAAYQSYVQHENQAFRHILTPAHVLLSIQTHVGKELYQSSQDRVLSTQLLSNLESAIVLMMGVIILILLQSSSLPLPKAQKYWLN